MLSIEFHRQRRLALLSQLKPNSVCVVAASRLQTRSRDTEYSFRQNSDFWYLTGFPEPDAWLVLSNSDEFDGEYSLIACLPKDKSAEIWHGRRVGPDAAPEQFAIDDACSTEQVEWALHDVIDGHDNLYVALGDNDDVDELIFAVLDKLRSAPKQSKKAPTAIIDIRPIVHEMRLFKQPEELTIMRRAAQISAEAHCRAMQSVKTVEHEYQLEAAIHHEFAHQGARFPAYNSIVGSGDNACILHYTENNAPLNQGDLVLIDAGAELHGYAADITRTFPVTGQFTSPQKQVYQIVLDSQLAALQQLRPGNTVTNAMQACLRVLVSGLVDLGILSGEIDNLIEEKAYQDFFMHGLGHWLGLDVHDVGDYKYDGHDRPLKPGMVMTVEPGLYFSPDADVPEQYRGIGIRIEDDIIITEEGNEIMTNAVPKTIDGIEQLMQQGA